MFLSHNFYTQIIAFQSEQAEKKYTDGKKVQLKERKKLVIQGRKFYHLESNDSKHVLNQCSVIFHKLWNTLFHIIRSWLKSVVLLLL